MLSQPCPDCSCWHSGGCTVCDCGCPLVGNGLHCTCCDSELPVAGQS